MTQKDQTKNEEQSIFENNPLHGLKLESLLEELVNHYGFEILAEYTRINCFKNNPSMASSIKFFKKTEWAREKIERFYLYDFKNLPLPGKDQFEIPPRDRIIPMHHKPREPKVLEPGKAPPPKVFKDEHKKHGSYANDAKQSFEGSNNKPAAKRKPVKDKEVPASDDPWANSPR